MGRIGPNSFEDRWNWYGFWGAGTINQKSFGSGQNWLEFLRERVGLVKLSVGAGMIGQISFRSDWDWTDFHQKWTGLVIISSGADRTGETGRFGENSIRSIQDCLEFLGEQKGLFKLSGGIRQDLVRVSLRIYGIGQKSFRSRQDWLNCQEEWMGLAGIPSGKGKNGIKKPHTTTMHSSLAVVLTAAVSNLLSNTSIFF